VRVYTVKRDKRGWLIQLNDGGNPPCRVGSGFPSRKAAVNTARLLAGMRGAVQVETA